MHSLSPAAARRIAASAPFAPVAGTREALDRLGALQLDPMSRVERAHRLTVLTRMRPPRAGQVAEPAALDAGLWNTGPAQTFEAFVHALCVLPIDYWPYWRERHESWRRRYDGNAELMAEWARVRELVAASEAGLTLGELELAEARTTGWNYSRTKSAVEVSVGAGRLIVSERRAGVRVFDLPERRIPAAVFTAEPEPAEGDDALVGQALRVLGIATTRELAQQVRIPLARAAATLERLAQADAAEEVSLEGVAQWIDPAAVDAAPRAVRWLGPFDNAMWDRARVQRLFGLDYRLEAYVPKAKRVHGPYALVVLVDDRMVGRIDLRAERRAGALEVVGWVPEPGRIPVARLRESLPKLARQLGLAEVRGSERLG